MKPAPCVLIVDASAESREVLRLLLERRGVRTLEAEHPRAAMRLAGQFQPDLIVFDAEADPDAADDAASTYARPPAAMTRQSSFSA